MPKVDTEADEQHRERDRYEVERPDTRKPSAAVIASPMTRLTNTARMMRPDFEREPENDQHDHDGPDAVHHHAFLHGGELLVGDRDRPGQAHARAVFGRELEIASPLADRVGRFLAGLQRGEVELRLDVE
jgi:hypothetical protein